MRGHLDAFSTFTPTDWLKLKALYYGSVSFMDNAIGHLLSAAEAALNMENTIVIYLADHGEVLGDHHFKGKWLYHYESSNRVPLIWRHDNHCQAGTNRHEFVELCDFTPTVLAAAGIATDNKMDGRSYLPLLQGIPIPDWRDHAYSESCNYLAATTDTPETIFWPRTIRSANYRCTFNTDPAVGELYNLHQDPDESCNLFHNPAYRGVIEEHRQRLESRGFIFKTPPPPRPYNV